MKSILEALKKFFTKIFSFFGLCKCNNEESKENALTVAAPANLVLENVVSMNRQDMYLKYGGDYRWFESCVLLKDYLDEENDGTIAGISNVFQVMAAYDEKSFDVQVVLYATTSNDSTVEVKHSFWVEDHPLNDEAINVTFKQAYDKLMATNCPKPHSKHCVLRKQVGPVDANPQYIFGNSEMQVYVDAVTGDVNLKNPAFIGFDDNDDEEETSES